MFFLSDSTGISAETMGNALLIQFPDHRFERRLIPFITTVEEAERVVAVLDEAMAGPVTPLAFSTTAVPEIRDVLHRTRCPLIDFFDLHMARVESILGAKGMHVAARLHGVGDIQRYNARMAAVEYAIEHDDGQSLRALEKADVILLAPSRCGKTPTTMYLALQHGVFVANYPLVPEDLESARPAAPGPRPAEPVLRDHHHPRPADPGPQRAPAQLPLRLARAVQLRDPPRRGPVPGPPAAGDQLLGQVGGGDVHRHPAVPRQALRPGPSRPPVPPLTKETVVSTLLTPGVAPTDPRPENVRWLSDLGLADLEQVGGKNSSLGEMISQLSGLGVRVPGGFATTAGRVPAFPGRHRSGGADQRPAGRSGHR